MLQLASGQTVSTYVSTFLSPYINQFSSLVNNGQALAASAMQQLNGNYSAAMQSIPAAIQNANTSIQQYAANAAASTPSAQAQIQACLDQANQSLSVLNNTSSK